ncbi:MAG: 50S ribosomal protein L30 [bacterium]|nr:50S ribosomal protein L30 [bacterium]
MARLKITQLKSTIDRKEAQKRTMVALGLRKLHHSVVHNDTPEIRGMINTVGHLVKVETVE